VAEDGPMADFDKDLAQLQTELFALVGVGGTDAEMGRALACKCAKFALPAAVAAGVHWGTPLVAAGSVTLPGLGTISGVTAALLIAAGAGGGSFFSCMSLLPMLRKARDELVLNPAMRLTVKQELTAIAALARGRDPRSARAG
jgi:hypothetical protein